MSPLKRPTNSGKVVVKGTRVNRGGGYGLEIPCRYTFEGDSFSIKWLRGNLAKEKFEVKNSGTEQHTVAKPARLFGHAMKI